MRKLIIQFCLWVLAKLNYSGDFVLPPSMSAYSGEVADLVAAEFRLNHGSTDILGDSWLKFRRVATALKKAHPEVLKRDIFKAIIVIHEAIENVQN